MLLTEQVKPQTIALLKMSALEIVKSVNSEDETIRKVVQQALPVLASGVELITERLNQGGRLLYFGAGTELDVRKFWMGPSVLRLSAGFRKWFKTLSPEQK